MSETSATDLEKTVTVVVGFPSGGSIALIASAHQPTMISEGHLMVLNPKGYAIASFAPGYWTATAVQENTLASDPKNPV
jgi:hypothetical protein